SRATPIGRKTKAVDRPIAIARKIRIGRYCVRSTTNASGIESKGLELGAPLSREEGESKADKDGKPAIATVANHSQCERIASTLPELPEQPPRDPTDAALRTVIQLPWWRGNTT